MTKSDEISALIDNIAAQKIPVSRLSDESSPCIVTGFLSTGCYVLDAIMGGGLPFGRVVEIYGNTSTGKSLVAAQACASVQEDGGIAVYVDTEAAVSLPIMKAVGVDIDNLVYTAPDTVESVFAVMEAVIESEHGGDLLIVWDSIAATSSQAEMDKNTGEVGYLTHARVISQGLRKLTRLISKRHISCLFLNQAKTNMGMMFGDRVATFGGKAVGFHSSIRVQLSVKTKIKRGDRIVGIISKAKVTKNKVSPPFREALLPIFFGHGVDDALAAFEFLKSAKAITSAGGSSYKMDGISGKFSKAKWPTVCNDSYDIVYDAIDNVVGGMDLI
jgi:recombination protein RecA